MKWLRSIVAIGAGVAVAYELFLQVWVRVDMANCDYGFALEGRCAKVPLTGFAGLAHGAARAFAGPWIGPFNMWGDLVIFAGWVASAVVAGFVTALIAPSRRLLHAIVVGPLAILCWFMILENGILGLDDLVHVLAWAWPAALGGVIAWTIARLRARLMARV